MAAVVLAPLELDDLDLLAARLRHDLARDLRRAQPLGADDHLVVTSDEDDGGERDGRARLSRQLLDRDHLARRHTVLLTAACDDRFHDLSPFPDRDIRKRLSEHGCIRSVNDTGCVATPRIDTPGRVRDAPPIPPPSQPIALLTRSACTPRGACGDTG